MSTFVVVNTPITSPGTVGALSTAAKQPIKMLGIQIHQSQARNCWCTEYSSKTTNQNVRNTNTPITGLGTVGALSTAANQNVRNTYANVGTERPRN